eukprot:TRINITY_DN7256_c0_g1_i3.p1 TRINITY_DN7256_c0_g1~~TRINITY_DN7256_c0_g1_i3.p1  ORF type:complete len:395 (+),score=124.02 TRINITY_DN7256_c0_g1_i3:414-1598(+)
MEARGGEARSTGARAGSNSRTEQLQSAYQALKEGPGIQQEQLLQVANVWRTLQGVSLWDASKIQRLVSKMSLGADGCISENEFVLFFDKMLPNAQDDFNQIVAGFMDLAQELAPEERRAVSEEEDDDKPEKMLLDAEKELLRAMQEERRLKAIVQASSRSSDNPAESKQSEHRNQALQFVFREFDLDGSGTIEAAELLALGKTRRELGQRGGVWSPERNMRAVSQMDTDGDGCVSMQEFVRHYNNVLPAMEPAFDTEISNFMDVARATRSRRISKEAENVSRVTARCAKLEVVFKEFDLNASGAIEAAELLELGKTRRELGQRGGVWSPERNMRAVSQMDTDGHGCVSMQEFVRHFEQVLPVIESEFDNEISNFMEVARAASCLLYTSPSPRDS